MSMISRKGFFLIFGDRLIMSAVVTDLLEFGLCGKPTAEMLIFSSSVLSAFSAQLGKDVVHCGVIVFLAFAL